MRQLRVKDDERTVSHSERRQDAEANAKRRRPQIDSQHAALGRG